MPLVTCQMKCIGIRKEHDEDDVVSQEHAQLMSDQTADEKGVVSYINVDIITRKAEMSNPASPAGKFSRTKKYRVTIEEVEGA